MTIDGSELDALDGDVDATMEPHTVGLDCAFMVSGKRMMPAESEEACERYSFVLVPLMKSTTASASSADPSVDDYHVTSSSRSFSIPCYVYR